MRDDDPTRNDANDCDAAGCEACGLRSTSVGEVNGRLLCAGCFDREAEALHAAEAKRVNDRLRRNARRRATTKKRARPIECPHWDWEDPDPNCECVGGGAS